MTANMSVHTEHLKEVAPPLLLLPDDELHAHHIQRPLLGNPDLAAYTGLAHRLVGAMAGAGILHISMKYDGVRMTRNFDGGTNYNSDASQMNHRWNSSMMILNFIFSAVCVSFSVGGISHITEKCVWACFNCFCGFVHMHPKASPAKKLD